ncbi:hypothetical protein GE09DRAFT_1064446 [Coniochaeta sp. 2T2.1]|nr:hypothetical protein GE09DRAFT_1064446 [Coniochaeta sp. 2T2.1]
MASAVLAVSLLVSQACASVLPPHDVQVSYGTRSLANLAPLSPRGIEARADHNKTFDIGWQVQDQPLFSANWTGGTGYIPIGGVIPVEASATESFSLSVECNDCRTFGHILADFNDDEGLNMSLTFNNVGVHMDFGVFAAQKGTFTIGLGRFSGQKPAGQNVNGIFNATVGIGIDLVLSFTGDVKATGGFQIGIPDKEQIGLFIDLPDMDDILAGNFSVSAGLDLVPQINFAILPIHVSRASANITAAIVLRAEAGIGLQKTPLTQNLDFVATAMASLTLAEVTFGTVFTDGSDGACRQSLFVDVGSSAAAEAVVGGEIAGHEFEHGPEVSTVFLEAGTTTCLDGRTDAIVATATKTSSSAPVVPACPTAALVTQTRNVTKTFSLTSCLISAINCPASLTQVVLVTDVQAATTTLCPSVNGTNAVAAVPATTVPPATFYTSGVLALPPLTKPYVTSIAPEMLANVTAPVNATVVGVAVTVPVLTTPPPEATAQINVGGKNESLSTTVKSEAGGSRVEGCLVALGAVLVGAVLLL